MNEERLVKSANYVRSELPVRIAHRLRDLQSLPYVVVTQENIARVYELYWSAFEQFRKYPQINNLRENDQFCDFCTRLLKEHVSIIPHLALGMSLSSPHLAPEYLDAFMRRMLVSRISRRVLVEHHIALTEDLLRQYSPQKQEKRVGIISTELDAHNILERCATFLQQQPARFMNGMGGWTSLSDRVRFKLDGQRKLEFPYIRDHLEYVIYELLKNAFQATLLKHPKVDRGKLPVVRATVVSSANELTIRISDQGGGIAMPSVNSTADIFSFSHARNPTRLEDTRLGALRSATARSQGLLGTLKEQIDLKPETAASHPKLGIGLPMSNIYAKYFGGSLDIISLDGWGTDVYLRVPKLGTKLEGIEV